MAGTLIPGEIEGTPYDGNNFSEASLDSTVTIGGPDNSLICDRTGFKIRVSEGLRTEWDGKMVRAKSWEPRHPQDFIRARASDDSKGSPRPEPEDLYIADLYPDGQIPGVSPPAAIDPTVEEFQASLDYSDSRNSQYKALIP